MAGRQRASSPLIDVVRGATSRIRDYRRIQTHSQVDIAVISRAVEPVVLCVAELLDNAARHSQPNTTVQVSLQPAHNGAAIVIDDAGVGLHELEMQHAARLLTGQRTVDINRLGDPPRFGFVVIGVLAARYGFSVSVDTRSPYGGVRAVVFVPNALLTTPQADEPVVVPAVSPRPAPGGTPPASPPAPSSTAGGLPKRRRQPVTEHSQAAAEPEPSAPRGRSAQDVAAVIGAFHRGTRSGRASAQDHEGHPRI